MTLFDQVKHLANGTQIIREWLGEGGVPVSYEQAQSRALVCLSCPNNVPGGFITDAVANAIKAHLELKAKLSLKVSGERRLAQCSVCQCQLRLKIWCPVDLLRRRALPEDKLPAHCWQLTEP